MHQSLWREIWILVTIAFGSIVLGLITGRPFLIAAVGFGLYIGSQLRHLHQLHQWLLSHKKSQIPDAEGLWGDVFAEIRKLEKHAVRREDRLTGMIARFQDTTAALPDAVVILSQKNEIEWANLTARQLLGVHFPRDTGLRLFNLLRLPELQRYFEIGDLAEPLEMPSPEQPDHYLSVQVIPFDPNRKLMIARDVTRLVRLEQMRRNFVANVSHEMRTPITVLAGFIETLRDMPNVDREELVKYLDTMHEQANRMQRLVGDLLMLSKLETAPPQRRDEIVDVPAMLAGLREQAELISGGAAHKISLECDPHLGLKGSREELHSAFSNLINNAVRYTPARGHIQLRWYRQDAHACFAVSDTGEGIAAEHIPQLTERFYRVDTARSRATGGTGLGLSIVKHVLIRHGARLEIESEIGKGSTFICIFPAERIVTTSDNNSHSSTSGASAA